MTATPQRDEQSNQENELKVTLEFTLQSDDPYRETQLTGHGNTQLLENLHWQAGKTASKSKADVINENI